MGIIQNLVTLCGVFGIIALLFILFRCHFHGWTLNWMTNYLFGSTKEEKMVLTKPESYNQNGCMIPSSDSSEFALSGRGSFRHFDKTDQDYTLLRQTSNSSLVSNSSPRVASINIGGTNIPPQPLRPAPIPPYIVSGSGSLQSQSSLDSVFATAPNSPGPHSTVTIPHPSGNSSTPPHRGGSGSGDGLSSNFSNNNPFLPLIQASTQFFTQKFQSFQQQSAAFTSNGNGSHGSGATPIATTLQSSNSRHHSVVSHPPNKGEVSKGSTVSSGSDYVPIPTTKPMGVSMGEILFSSPPAHSMGSSLSDRIMEQCRKDTIEQCPAQAGKSDKDKEWNSDEVSRESLQNSASAQVQHATIFSTSGIGGGSGISGTNVSEQRPQKSHVVPNLSTKPNLTTAVSISENSTIQHYKSELQQQSTGVNRSPSPSPTRIRDRQRKMEFTLQHIQNNPEDKPKICSASSGSCQVKKHHHNLDSHYPVSTPYVPKVLASDPAGGGGMCGDSTTRSMRYRSPHHRPVVPPLKEADELALNDESPPPSSFTSDKIDNDSFFPDVPTQLQTQPSITKSFQRPSLNSSCCDEVTCNKWILESMREEIRLENERMEDATKSLMMDEEFSSISLGESRKKEGNGVLLREKQRQEKEEKTKESRPILKSLALTNTTTSNYSSSKNTEIHGKLVDSETSVSAPVPEGIETLKSKDNSGISYANYNGGMGSSSSYIKTNMIPTEINPTGDVTTTRATTAFLDGAGAVGEQTTFSNNGNNGGGHINGSGSSSGYSNNSRPPMLGERAHSYSSAGPPQLPAPPFRNTRSFSLRQSSTDSIGSEAGSDGSGSPDGANFLPALQRAMSCDSVSSDTSVVLGDLDPPHPTGFLCVALEYDSETADLLVNVMEGKELVGPNSMAAFDSYVRVYLLPDKTTNMQTRVCRKSLNPVYREKFMFGVETIELPLRTLVFYLYATDKYSNTLVGETEIKLGDLDIYQPITTWLQLTDTGQKGGESGEIMFSLSYLPTAERLTVVVVKARNLKFPHERETGVFVKVYLLQKGKKVSKKKSSTKRGEKNPIFNEAMIFSVPVHTLQTIQLRITVADTCEIEGRANSIGHVIVGAQTSGKPLSHWNQMLSSLRKPIAMWHPLFK